MAIPSVEEGCIQTNEKFYNLDIDGIGLDSPAGLMWLESITSFRFEPEEGAKPFTARKEPTKTGSYWYGYRKIAGKLHKKYIGKTSEINTEKLEEIAKALDISPELLVTDKVTEVTETSNQVVTDKVTDIRTDTRLTALELQVQVLQESLEVLRRELLGKFAEGDSCELPSPDVEVTDRELPSPDVEVTDSELQIRVGNLKSENEKLKADYDALLESSIHVTNKLRQEVQELRSQVEAERADREEIETELSELKKKSVAAARQDLPEAADLLNQLRAERKKLKMDLADMEALREILKNRGDKTLELPLDTATVNLHSEGKED